MVENLILKTRPLSFILFRSIYCMTNLDTHICTMGHKHNAEQCSASALQEFEQPQILDPELSSLDLTLSLQFDSDQSRSETYRQSVSSSRLQRADTPHSRNHEYDADRLSTHNFFHDNESPTPSLRRRTSSRSISLPPAEPNNLSLTLELLPWIVGLLWIANIYFGSK